MIRFIVDAQLPYRLAKILRARQIDIIHMDVLPNKELTSDKEIREIAEVED